MISCARARELLLEHVRGAVGEATLLRLDLHLAACEGCQVERARWETVSALKDWQPAPLAQSARERILKRLVEARPEAPSARRSVSRPLMLFAGAAAAAALLMMAWPHRHPAPASSMVASTARQSWAQPGALRFAGADVGYRAGTVAELRPETRTIALDAGELDVAGRPDGPLRVVTPVFVVRLVDAHAAFAPSSVRVLSGEVYVYSLDERQLATLKSGESWPPDANANVVNADANANVVNANANANANANVANAKSPTLSAAAALDRARSALADGDAPLARRFIQRALAAAPSLHQRAEAELFGAESYLVDSQPARAVELYRRVASSYARLPEGEAAAFAAAQLRSENDGSREAFRAYLDRYPDGRFAREARDRLAEPALIAQ